MKPTAQTIHTTHHLKNRHYHTLLLFIPSIIFALCLSFLVGRYRSYNVASQEKTSEMYSIKINETEIITRRADTTSEHAKGLSGVASLQENEGMLFVFGGKTRPSFWMKDMLIPLDFIWIVDGKVSFIIENVEAPPSGTPERDLKLYLPPDFIDHVLEVNAGFVKKNNIKVGDSVQGI